MTEQTERIIQAEMDSFVDCLFSYLIQEGDAENSLVDGLPWNLNAMRDRQELASVLDCAFNKAQDWDHCAVNPIDAKNNEVCIVIPYGEIEIEADCLDEDSREDWYINERGYAYMPIPSILITFDLNKLACNVLDVY